mmetsp:Transcript_17962/g.52078  ORF Transcript_17962/g.52078 Transcript_17962/m.52078 type:complete len:144 (+) Transcript_17962:370-801(+)
MGVTVVSLFFSEDIQKMSQGGIIVNDDNDPAEDNEPTPTTTVTTTIEEEDLLCVHDGINPRRASGHGLPKPKFKGMGIHVIESMPWIAIRLILFPTDYLINTVILVTNSHLKLFSITLREFVVLVCMWHYMGFYLGIVRWDCW